MDFKIAIIFRRHSEQLKKPSNTIGRTLEKTMNSVGSQNAVYRQLEKTDELEIWRRAWPGPIKAVSISNRRTY